MFIEQTVHVCLSVCQMLSIIWLSQQGHRTYILVRQDLFYKTGFLIVKDKDSVSKFVQN